ncbi:MAG: L-serine ammonia-lyase [Salinivirgaceae bacterium]|nr:L-serine ammonia-lyase [Salinivirgaceae bacterium]
MESIKTIYRIGHGPSSSHTMGPRKASLIFLEKFPDAPKYRVTLYGSLAATGIGHLTDVAILTVFKDAGKPIELIWKPTEFLPRHPNALLYEALSDNNEVLLAWHAYSIGGGAVVDDDNSITTETVECYPFANMAEILKYCNSNGLSFWETVERYDDSDIWDYLATVWQTMQDSIERGLENEGVLPGSLKLPRKAVSYSVKANGYKGTLRKRAMLFAYALAVAEENAAGGLIVTAPTCGSCGVIPSVLYYLKMEHKFSDTKILRALAAAGLIGAIVKQNASISGAEVGCQGEIGTACAMASGAISQLFGGTIFQVEYSAEMGLEHHLGLTCDPVAGLVQIPCIERNAFAAARALNHNAYAMLGDGRHRISFDTVVATMRKTGHDLPKIYRETSEGGLACYSGMADDI